VIGSAPPERAGAASALSETAAELGGAMGIAVLGTLGMTVYRSRLGATLPPDLPPTAAAAAQDTFGNVVAQANQLAPALGEALLTAARLAFTQGLQLLSLIAAVVMAGLVVLAATMLRDTTGGSEPPSHETIRSPDVNIGRREGQGGLDPS
jgi:MFS transporter, DHA2 family, multidrug resistance protein